MNGLGWGRSGGQEWSQRDPSPAASRPVQTVSRTGNQASEGGVSTYIPSRQDPNLSNGSRNLAEGTLQAAFEQGTGDLHTFHTSERRWTYSQQPQTTTTLYPYVPSQAMGPLRTFHESQIQKLSQPSYPNASPFSLKEGSTLTSPEQRKEGFSLDDQILDDAMDLKDRLVFPRPCFLPPWAPGWEHTAVIGLGLVVRTQAAERRWAPREGTAFLRHVLVSISSHCCQTHARPLGLPSQSQVLNRNISSRTIYTGFSLGGCSWQVREN